MDWQPISEDDTENTDRLLVSTKQPNDLASYFSRLPIHPVAVAYRQWGLWWASTGRPGEQPERLWFEPDVFMPLPEPPEAS